ncbi:MAG: DUF4397 domain-containing protein [Gammaproteobacteria bacterium]|nr:DUF4397 domain-containing protein [Gammaproteobacteria bacterium]
MKHWAWLVLPLAAWAGGCVSSQDAESSAVRMLNAVADSSNMALTVSGQRRSSATAYGAGTSYLALGVGRFTVRIDEALPLDADPDIRTLYSGEHALGVNDELTLVVLGQEASDAVEVLAIPSKTRGVSIGKTRMQFVHAGFGLQPVDIYVGAVGSLPQASTPLVAGMAYGEFTVQTELAGGNAQIIVTPAGDPATILLDSGRVQLPAEGTWLVAVIANPEADAARHPISLSVLTGTGSSLLRDKDASALLRFVNASPGTYAIDGFANSALLNGTERQDCDPATTEPETAVEQCAQPFRFIGPFHEVVPGTYQLKTQKAADAAVSARSVTASFAAGTASTVVTTGLIADEDEATTTGLQIALAARRMHSAALLRVVNVSQAAVMAVQGDPSTDRLELYITPPCELPDAESEPVLGNLAFGSDTSYLARVPGDYQLSLARVDRASSGTSVEVLLSRRLTLAAGGVYTEFVIDSLGATLPPDFLSVDDDPGFQGCPGP